MKKIIVILLLCFSFSSIFGQARQRGIIEFNTIAELKNTPLKPQDSDFAVVVNLDNNTRQLFNYEALISGDEINYFSLNNYSGSWVRISNGLISYVDILAGGIGDFENTIELFNQDGEVTARVTPWIFNNGLVTLYRYNPISNQEFEKLYRNFDGTTVSDLYLSSEITL